MSDSQNPQLPDGVEPISWNNLGRLGVHRETGALYWDGKEVVTKSWIRLGNFERWMAALAATGTFGSFIVALWSLWHPR
jgi:hypothetical protein